MTKKKKTIIIILVQIIERKVTYNNVIISLKFIFLFFPEDSKVASTRDQTLTNKTDPPLSCIWIVLRTAINNGIRIIKK